MFDRRKSEFLFDATVLISVGGMAFGGSASHVYELAISNGQKGFGAYSVTAISEILFAYSGLEIRRRKDRKAVPAIILVLAAMFIIWANLESTTKRTTTGFIISVAPALAFGAVAILAETRSWVSKRRPVRSQPATRTLTLAPETRIAAARSQGGERSSSAVVSAQELGKRAARQAELQGYAEQWRASLTTDKPMTTADVAAIANISQSRARNLVAKWKIEKGFTETDLQ